VADFGEHALVSVAKERGVPVVELQHGYLDQFGHHAYSWTSLARPFKPRMTVPDYFLLYGEHWRRELCRGGFWEEELRVVGSPRIDNFRREVEGVGEGRLKVVVTTQGLDVPRLVEYLAAFLDGAEGRIQLGLDIKLHPIYETDKRLYE
jgi:hypothetical protein